VFWAQNQHSGNFLILWLSQGQKQKNTATIPQAESLQIQFCRFNWY